MYYKKPQFDANLYYILMKIFPPGYTNLIKTEKS